mmetsp:Transcript_21152/g.29622  ORF Transcript_21152/g.29622 Transcript_21152/m.29622 type:complete len:412 (-) Transcript_21152:111-1346(-)
MHIRFLVPSLHILILRLHVEGAFLAQQGLKPSVGITTQHAPVCLIVSKSISKMAKDDLFDINSPFREAEAKQKQQEEINKIERTGIQRFTSPFLHQHSSKKLELEVGSVTLNDEEKHTSDSTNGNNDNISISKTNTAMIILNSPIQNPPGLVFQTLWGASSFHVCADGGANRLYEATVKDDECDVPKSSNKELLPTSDPYIPDLIKGDLDSLRPDVETYYKRKGCAIKRDTDQDTNDLDKAMQSIQVWATNLQYLPSDEKTRDLSDFCANARVYVFGAFGGRFDQEMASIQALYRWCHIFRHNVVLYNDENCSFLLSPNIKHEIRMPVIGDGDDVSFTRNHGFVLVGEGPTCGLIPIGCRCDSVATTGLQWNLDGSKALEFGGIVSTSNKIIDKVVTVLSSHALLFTVEIR